MVNSVGIGGALHVECELFMQTQRTWNRFIDSRSWRTQLISNKHFQSFDYRKLKSTSSSAASSARWVGQSRRSARALSAQRPCTEPRMARKQPRTGKTNENESIRVGVCLADAISRRVTIINSLSDSPAQNFAAQLHTFQPDSKWIAGESCFFAPSSAQFSSDSVVTRKTSNEW